MMNKKNKIKKYIKLKIKVKNRVDFITSYPARSGTEFGVVRLVRA